VLFRSDFISPGENGEFIEYDPAQIATVLCRLCAQPQHLKTMGANARERVELNYTWDRVAQMTEDAYLAHLNACN
jgi:glycosyltransferase involved in cell wall biosynthesis